MSCANAVEIKKETSEIKSKLPSLSGEHHRSKDVWQASPRWVLGAAGRFMLRWNRSEAERRRRRFEPEKAMGGLTGEGGGVLMMWCMEAVEDQ